ncbi:MAG: hypothetical protein OEY19_03585 [Gammaproteobacteria bacterium]|nr:hypothetical protein [Gammaproteobacteria bacterium]MDH5630190.1 hypothetical protein [Gammaproteobacteria bacterium]
MGWSSATEEKLDDDGFCDRCQQEVKAGDSLWIDDNGDVLCSTCRQSEIDKGN